MQEENINDMDEDMRDMIKDLNLRVRRIETSLLGDADLGSKGFVTRFEIVENQVEENTEKLDKIWIIAGTIGGITAGVFQLITTFLL